MALGKPLGKPLAQPLVQPLGAGLSWEESGGVKLWTPLDLAPDAWWRSDNVVITGSGVSTWTDLSGNGVDLTQGTDANRPTISAADADFGGRDVLSFDGAGDHVDQVSDTPLDVTTGDLSIVAIAYVASTGATSVIVDKLGAGANGYFLGFTAATSITATVGDGTTVADSYANAGNVDATGILRLAHIGGTSVAAYFNGTTGGPTAHTEGSITAVGDEVSVGARAGAGVPFTGRVAEVIVCLRQLTAVELTKITDYANTRYSAAFPGA